LSSLQPLPTATAAATTPWRIRIVRSIADNKGEKVPQQLKGKVNKLGREGC